MFLRATKTHSKAGQPAYSVRLVQSRRSGSSVRQKTLLNLGTGYPVPKKLWPQVAATASDIFHGQESLLAVDPDVLSAAEHLVRRLRERGFQASGPDADSRFATVDLDTLQHDATRSVGAERLCLHALDQLGFQNLLLSRGASLRDTKIATALLVARMLHPSSEREALRWLQKSTALLEVLGLDSGPGLSLSKLYRTNDLLFKHREALQEGLFQRERELLQLSGTVVFYDLTNVHYSGRENRTLRRFGRSKQKRNDCPLVTLALALDGEGFPRRCDVLPGNVSEPGTLQGALEKLAQDTGAPGPRPTVVLDAGIATQANIEWLDEHGWEWIAVSREAKPDPPEGDPEAVVRTQGGYEVRVWPVAQEQADGEDAEEAAEERDGRRRELRLFAVSEARQRREQDILEKHRQRYEEALQHLHAGLSVPGRLKNLEKVQRKVGHLRERHKRVASHYEVTVTPETGKDGKPAGGKRAKAAAVEYTHKPKHAAVDAAAGGYMLRTSHTDWNAERVLRTYWTLTEVEATFRELKQSLGLRPIHHSLDRRVSAHLFIAVLAYHGVHLIRTRLRAQGIRLSWQSIREELRDWTRVTTTVRTTDGTLITNRQDVRPTPEAARIAKAAGLQPRLYRRRMRTGEPETSQSVVPSGAEAKGGQPGPK